MKNLIIVATLFFYSSTVAVAHSLDWQEVEKIFDREGIVQGEVFKITFPRSDLKVKVDKVYIEPGLAFTSWVAFKGTKSHAMMMGDMVLLEREITPVMTKLVKSGLEVTALHNHIVGESPKIMYMHFSGHGDPKQLAETMRAALELTGTPLKPSQPQESAVSIDWTKVESILGWTGQRKGNLLQLGIPRAETITEDGADIPPFMGLATVINLQAVGNRAATTGDFVLLGNEVNPVVKALTEHGIAVTAIHNHMLFESPRLFFLHFWGVDEAEKLAKGLKAALDKTNSVQKN